MNECQPLPALSCFTSAAMDFVLPLHFQLPPTRGFVHLLTSQLNYLTLPLSAQQKLTLSPM